MGKISIAVILGVIWTEGCLGSLWGFEKLTNLNLSREFFGSLKQEVLHRSSDYYLNDDDNEVGY